MTVPVAAHSAAGAHIVSDTAFFWIETVMVVVIILGLIASYFIARSNTRMAEETRRLLEQRRDEQDSAEANIDALAGRPEQPQTDRDA